MPELPEVESIRRELVDKVINKKILGVEVFRPSFIRSGSLSSAVNCKITDLRRRGKYVPVYSVHPRRRAISAGHCLHM